jgi:hypothetical protein
MKTKIRRLTGLFTRTSCAGEAVWRIVNRWNVMPLREIGVKHNFNDSQKTVLENLPLVSKIINGG